MSRKDVTQICHAGMSHKDVTQGCHPGPDRCQYLLGCTLRRTMANFCPSRVHSLTAIYNDDDDDDSDNDNADDDDARFQTLPSLLPAPYFSLFFVTCILLNNKYNLVSLHALRT